MPTTMAIRSSCVRSAASDVAPVFSAPFSSSHRISRAPQSCLALSRRSNIVSNNCRLERAASQKRALQHVPTPPRTARSSPTGSFTYKVAAAYSGKRGEFKPATSFFNFDSTLGLEQPEEPEVFANPSTKLAPSGQDAFFVSNVDDTGVAAWAVADGVGGWADQGIDSAAFAHGLCRYMRRAARDYPQGFKRKGPVSPLDLLQMGYQKVCEDKTIVGGGSTACIGVADPDGSLTVANLGDSGFIHFRLNAVHHYSNPQTHAFNTPFQLSRVPPKILAQIQHFGGSSPFSDMPSDASVTTHGLRHGDVLIFATDGVWDNLSSQELLDHVSTCMVQNGAWSAPPGGAVEVSKVLSFLTDGSPDSKSGALTGDMKLQTLIATDIVAKAKSVSRNPKRDGPFAKAVQQAFPNERFHGGKEDDICVVVIIAVDSSVV